MKSLRVSRIIFQIKSLQSPQAYRGYGTAAYVLAKEATAHAQLVSLENKAELVEFDKLLPKIVTDLTLDDEVKEADDWMAKAIEESITGDCRSIGLSLVESYKILRPQEKDFTKVRVLGWCLEILRASAQMRQDSLDEIESSAGLTKQKYEYLSKVLESSLFKVLKLNFNAHPSYTDIVDQFHESARKLVMGQALDHKSREDKTLNQFTMERYNLVARYKHSYLNFKLPVTLAMTLAGIEDQEVFRQAKTILLEMGNMGQAQLDFNNCYGCQKPLILPGRDIQKGKLTWPAVVALQRVSPRQKRDFIECYGSDDEEKVRVIKDIYSLVGIRTTYSRFRRHNFELLFTQIQQVSRGLDHKMFLKLLFSIPGLTE